MLPPGLKCCLGNTLKQAVLLLYTVNLCFNELLCLSCTGVLYMFVCFKLRPSGVFNVLLLFILSSCVFDVALRCTAVFNALLFF